MTYRYTTAHIIGWLAAREDDLRRDPDMLPKNVTWAMVGEANWVKNWSRECVIHRLDRFLSRPRHKQRRRRALGLAVQVARYWGIKEPAPTIT